MTNSFDYKNFDLGIVVSGAVGGDVMRNSDQGLTNLDGVFNNLKEIKDRWRSPQNPGKGKYGKTTSQTGPERNNISSRFIHKADFLTVKNITLGYNVPLKSYRYFKNIRAYASIQQAFVFSSYKRANPEVGVGAIDQTSGIIVPGQDWGSYPVPRTITFGLNLNF